MAFQFNAHRASERIHRHKELRRLWDKARKEKASDVWLESSDGASLGFLISGDRVMLTFFRGDGDAGLTSRAGDYDGPEDAALPFLLGNGQLDHYPVAWTVSTNDAFRVAAYFLRRGTYSPEILWHDCENG